MQCCLCSSMMKDFDSKLGISKYTLIERDGVAEFVFPCHLGIILVITNPQINPKKLAKKISKLVYELDFWAEAQNLR